MKKLYSLVIILALSGNLAYSQILTAPHLTTEYTGPDSVKLTAHAEIVNNGTQTLDVVCERIASTLTTDHFAYFCWVVCYDTSVYLSPTPIQVAPGGSITNFEGWMGSSNTPGHDEVTYRYYDMHGNSDTLYLTFKYDFLSSTGIHDPSRPKYSMNITSANPANTYVSFSHNAPVKSSSKIIISNLLGSKIREFSPEYNAGSFNIPVADLTSGIYLCSYWVDGIMMNTRKLIVSHY